MKHQAESPATCPEYGLEIFETGPSLMAGVHRVKGASGTHFFFVSIQEGLPLAIHVGEELLMDAPAGSSVVSVLAPNDAADQASELNRILETVLSRAAPASVTLSDAGSLVARLPVFALMKGLVSQ